MRVPVAMNGPEHDRFDDEAGGGRQIGHWSKQARANAPLQVLGHQTKEAASGPLEPECPELWQIGRGAVEQLETTTIARQNVVELEKDGLEFDTCIALPTSLEGGGEA